MYILLTATENSNTIPGAFIALILAIAAAVPLLLRLYFKQKRREQKTVKKRLQTAQQIEIQKLKQQKREADQQYALEKRRMALEQKQLRQKVGRAIQEKQQTDAVREQLLKQQEEAASKRIADMADVDLFKSKAKRLGCRDDMSLAEMAKLVVSFAPEASLKELPEGLSDEEKAVALFAAYRKEETTNESKKEASTDSDDDSDVSDTNRVRDQVTEEY